MCFFSDFEARMNKLIALSIISLASMFMLAYGMLPKHTHYNIPYPVYQPYPIYIPHSGGNIFMFSKYGQPSLYQHSIQRQISL